MSRFRIPPDRWEKIFDLLLEAFTANKNKKDMNRFLSCLFTPTERIMFAKRMAACVLLVKNHSYRSITEILKISPPTIAKMSLNVKYNKTSIMPTIEAILDKQAIKMIHDEIKDLIDVPSKSTLRSPGRKRRKLKNKRKLSETKDTF